MVLFFRRKELVITLWLYTLRITICSFFHVHFLKALVNSLVYKMDLISNRTVRSVLSKLTDVHFYCCRKFIIIKIKYTCKYKSVCCHKERLFILRKDHSIYNENNTVKFEKKHQSLRWILYFRQESWSGLLGETVFK